MLGWPDHEGKMVLWPIRRPAIYAQSRNLIHLRPNTNIVVNRQCKIRESTNTWTVIFLFPEAEDPANTHGAAIKLFTAYVLANYFSWYSGLCPPCKETAKRFAHARIINSSNVECIRESWRLTAKANKHVCTVAIYGGVWCRKRKLLNHCWHHYKAKRMHTPLIIL